MSIIRVCEGLAVCSDNLMRANSNLPSGVRPVSAEGADGLGGTRGPHDLGVSVAEVAAGPEVLLTLAGDHAHELTDLGLAIKGDGPHAVPAAVGVAGTVAEAGAT